FCRDGPKHVRLSSTRSGAGFAFGSQAPGIGAGEVTNGQPHIRQGGGQRPSRAETARRRDHLRTQRHHTTKPRHATREFDVFKQWQVVKSANLLEHRSTSKNALITEEPTKPSRTPFPDPARRTQHQRAASKTSRETAAHDARLTKRVFDLEQRL